MYEYTARHFDDVCRDQEVKTEIDSIEEKRRRGVRRFWMLLLFGTLVGTVMAVALINSGWPTAGIIAGLVVFIAALLGGLAPLGAAKEELKHPVLERLARAGGMEYIPSGFEPPVFPSAARILFGGTTGRHFTDLFHGTDADGRRFAVYEATLTRRAGRNTVTIFNGQMYAFQRRSQSSGETAILPDKGLFNFIKPSGMDRVKFPADPEFEKKYEVYSIDPAAATMLVGSDVRRELLELRKQGRAFVYIGPEDALVALWGKDRFEPGSMFRARPGQERVKLMFDDVCASMNLLRRLKTVLD